MKDLLNIPGLHTKAHLIFLLEYALDIPIYESHKTF